LIEQHERSARLADILSGAGLDCRVSSNIDADVWHKLVVNCVVNPITAILMRSRRHREPVARAAEAVGHR
jgi:ketopantoate reductase